MMKRHGSLVTCKGVRFMDILCAMTGVTFNPDKRVLVRTDGSKTKD